MRSLKRAGEAELDHGRRDRDLQGDDRQQCPRPTLPRTHGPPDQITDECVSEYPVCPVNRREWAGVRDELPVAEREAAARRYGAQIRRQRAEQDSNEGEAEWEPA